MAHKLKMRNAVPVEDDVSQDKEDKERDTRNSADTRKYRRTRH